MKRGGAGGGQYGRLRSCTPWGLSEQTFSPSRNQNGGMNKGGAGRLKELEIEISRLKKAVADLTIDNQILREANDFLGKPRRPRGGGAS